MTEILCSIITGVCAVVGCVITTKASNQRLLAHIEVELAKQGVKIDSLSNHVEKHNNFAERVPVLEEKVDRLERVHDEQN